ncbi:MAG: YnbE family lipoprotein [Desulfuromonadaceae bacterium]|nr:YnbE family lipoprotein [Desulfuromonadaceae bacterium]
MSGLRKKVVPGVLLGMLVVWWSGCTPRVQVEAPDKPITINLNVKIEHEIKVKVDRELDTLFSADSGLF